MKRDYSLWVFLVLMSSVGCVLFYTYKHNQQNLSNYIQIQADGIEKLFINEDLHIDHAFQRLANRFFAHPEVLTQDAHDYLRDFKSLRAILILDQQGLIQEQFAFHKLESQQIKPCLDQIINTEAPSPSCQLSINESIFTTHTYRNSTLGKVVLFITEPFTTAQKIFENYKSSLEHQILISGQNAPGVPAQVNFNPQTQLEFHLSAFPHLTLLLSLTPTIHQLFHPILEYLAISIFGLMISILLAWVIHKYYTETRLRQQLQHKEQEATLANESKSKFLANISHEIRTPLNGIIGMGQVLSNKELDAESRDEVEYILKSGHWLVSLINDLLDFAKIESGRMTLEYTPVHLSSFLDDLKTLYLPLFDGKGVVFFCKFQTSDSYLVRTDPIKLKQVLVNLLANALKFTEKGKVVFSVIKIDGGPQGSQRYEFSVQDTGIGVAPQNHELIFQDFRQEDDSISRVYGGTGLGLSISKRIVASLGGQIQLESRLQHGSRFFFKLDLPTITQSHKPEPVPALDTNPNPFLSINLLLVEDNAINQKVASKMLTKMNVQFKIADNGKIAEDLLQQERFDLILLDLQMPVQDGLTTLHRIRSNQIPGVDPQIPILVVSANAGKEEIDAAFKAGANNYITKPYNLIDLQQKIQLLSEM